MKARVLALLLVGLLLGLASMIPDGSSTAYPPPPVPGSTPYAEPISGFVVEGATDCATGFLSWWSRPLQFPAEGVKVHAVTWDWEVWLPAEMWYKLGDTEYYRASFDLEIMGDRTWSVEGISTVEDVPINSTTNHIVIVCGLTKQRVRVPLILKGNEP